MRIVKTLLQRCGDVVEFMASGGAACRLSAIAAALDLPKSTTHRLLRELLDLGWMEQDGADGPYRLSLRFALLGHRVLQTTGLPDLVQPVLDALAAETRELVRLTMIRDGAAGSGLVWFASAQGAPPGLLYQPAMGGDVVLHATANGKAFLATATDAQAMVLARRAGFGKSRPTARTLTTPGALRAELAQARARGYATAIEEAETGITAVAVGIGHAGGAGLGTVSVAGPSMRILPDRIPQLAEQLRRAAAALAAIGPHPASRQGAMHEG